MDVIGMPVYSGDDFEVWINSTKGGYIRV